MCYYSTMVKLAKAIPLIPHGNADTERLWSQKTKYRNSFDISTLNSLLTLPDH